MSPLALSVSEIRYSIYKWYRRNRPLSSCLLIAQCATGSHCKFAVPICRGFVKSARKAHGEKSAAVVTRKSILRGRRLRLSFMALR